MKYVKIAQTTDLKIGEKKKIFVEGKEILLANIDGAYYSIDNKCPHMGGSLADGKLEGNNIVCPKHGSIFDVKTGKVSMRGKLFFIDVKVTDLKSYPVKIEDEDILIDIE